MSSVMMSFFSRPKAAPAPAANGLTQTQANAVLVKALHNVANVKLRNALQAAKNAANAAKNGTIAERNKTIAELKAALNEAKPVVTAAANVAPNKPAENQTLAAENAAVNAVARNAAALANFNQRIIAANNAAKLTQIEVNIQKYANNHGIPYNRNNIKKRINAVNTKRNNIRLPSHPLAN
jgi:hypothetical protein